MMAEVVTGYLIGSLPLGFFLARRAAGVDLRSVGSHNVGASNVYRIAGMRLGLLVMGADVAKGAIAVLAAGRWLQDPVVAGVAAVAGHVYPVWLRGQGGKGVATACGAFAVLAPLPTLGAAVLFALVVAGTRVASAGSVAATLALPLLAFAFRTPRAVVLGAATVAILILWRHRGNVVRLWQGTERRLQPGASSRA